MAQHRDRGLDFCPARFVRENLGLGDSGLTDHNVLGPNRGFIPAFGDQPCPGQNERIQGRLDFVGVELAGGQLDLDQGLAGFHQVPFQHEDFQDHAALQMLDGSDLALGTTSPWATETSTSSVK